MSLTARRTLARAAVFAVVSTLTSACSLLVDGAIDDPMMMPGPCEGLDDGTPCMREGIAALLVCVRGACTNSRCGDGLIDARPGADEACDDGNGVGGDGCESDCTASVGCRTVDDCVSVGDSDCLRNVCNADVGECVIETVEDGTACDDFSGVGQCVSGTCAPVGCQDGVLDPTTGEECDDGNDAFGDGCTPSCKPECRNNEGCAQGDVCLGAQQCVTSTDSNGGFLGRCEPSSSPLDCGDPRCAYCDSSVGGCVFAADVDIDLDGYGSRAAGCGDDCDDFDPFAFPDQPELCGPSDANCSGSDDEPESNSWYVDCDGDGHSATGAATVTACDYPTEPTSCTGGLWTLRAPDSDAGVDCRDDDSLVSPSQRGFFPRPSSLGTYDYTCDGVEEPEYRRYADPRAVSCVDCEGRSPPVLAAGAACGTTATLYACEEDLVTRRCTRGVSGLRYTVRCR